LFNALEQNQIERGKDYMRTLILSDLHLGNGGDYDIFSGSTDLSIHQPSSS